jgi:hypothetical protein
MKHLSEMPPVAECDVRDCAYNARDRCHARAITIGDGIHPACDTFVRSTARVDQGAAEAGVGACKVSSCSHNSGLTCRARSIHVGYHGDHPDCMTFSKK